MAAKRRSPEVVVFSEPARTSVNASQSKRARLKERDLFMRGDVGEVFSRQPPQLESKPSPSPSDEWVVSVDMKSALHQVKAFCGDGLTGIERRRYEEQRAKELGGKGHKPCKVPYPLSMKLRSIRKAKEEERREELRAQGVSLRRKKPEQKTVRGKGRWKDTCKSLTPGVGVGRMRGGVLQVTHRDIARSSGSSGGRRAHTRNRQT